MSDVMKNTLYENIFLFIKNAQQTVRTAVNSAMVITYWNVGRLIVEHEQKGEDKAGYGKALLQELSKRLTAEFGKGYTVTNLRYMRQFYLFFPELCDKSGKYHAVSDVLSWTHYRHLLKVENKQARKWYMEETAKENWSTRALERQINSFYYNRLIASQNKSLVRQEAVEKISAITPQDVLKDPYVLEFLQLKNRVEYTESELESALINELQNFLLELGSGFSFVARQKHFDLDGEHFYIDLVFYNYKLKCFILIDLKRGKLTHQDIGQMDTYMRIYEDKIRGEDDNPTIGLILSSDKNETIVKYSMLAENKQLFASKYKLYLPSEEELRNELVKEIQNLEQGENDNKGLPLKG